MSTNITNLRCEWEISPLGIAVKCPGFSWEYESDERNVRQKSYRIRCFKKERNTDCLEMVWDSGVVVSMQTASVIYSGNPLAPATVYCWSVETVLDNGKACSSSEAVFETAFFEEPMGSAKWIATDEAPLTRESYDFTKLQEIVKAKPRFSNPYHCPMIRRRFTLHGNIAAARLYATACGNYMVWCNGQRVSDRLLAPEWTEYNTTLMYQTYDVTKALLSGENALGFVLSPGWFAGKISVSGENCQYGDRLELIYRLKIFYDDGSSCEIVSDGSETYTAEGPYCWGELFVGDKYDATKEMKGWTLQSFDDSQWKHTRFTGRTKENIQCWYGEPVREVKRFRPKEIYISPKGETILDLGQNITGFVGIHVKGQRGTEVMLECTEMTDSEGNYLNAIPTPNKEQTDIYVLSGDKDGEYFEPAFTYHGFRYVRITGWPGAPAVEDFEAIVVSSDIRHTGKFICSDGRLTQLSKNVLWSQIGNMVSIPTDCPQREKCGWTGDIQVYSDTACYYMDMVQFLRRWLGILRDEAKRVGTGEVPRIAPFPETCGKTVYLDGSKGKGGCSAGWSDACIIVPWQLYRFTGDMRVLEENYDMMRGWVDYVTEIAETEIPERCMDNLSPEEGERQRYLWNTGFHFGEWLTPTPRERNGWENTLGEEIIASAYHAYTSGILSEIAHILGKEADSVRYSERSRCAKRAFCEEYIADGKLKYDYQGMYVVALGFKMSSGETEKQLAERLGNLVASNANKLDVGFLGVSMLLPVLQEYCGNELAYAVLMQEDCPGWLHPVTDGATTIWEEWDRFFADGSPRPCSLNHYAYGSVGKWLFEGVAGIRNSGTAYERFSIAPALTEKFSSAEAEYHSIHGIIRSGWATDGNHVTLKVSIPANTEAEITLPGKNIRNICEAGSALLSQKMQSGMSNGTAKIAIGSGNYEFNYDIDRIV